VLEGSNLSEIARRAAWHVLVPLFTLQVIQRQASQFSTQTGCMTDMGDSTSFGSQGEYAVVFTSLRHAYQQGPSDLGVYSRTPQMHTNKSTCMHT
jgi:hypothetical protein